MERIDVTGRVEVKVRRVDGSVDTYKGSNLVVDVGKALIASRFKDNTDAAISHMAIGSNNQNTTEADTALIGTEYERVTATVTVSDNQIQVAVEFGAGIAAEVTVGEFGIFNAAVAGSMLCRFVIAEITISPTDTIDVVWIIQFGD